MGPSEAGNCSVAQYNTQKRIVHPVCDHDSSVELDQVLKDQLTPTVSARLDQQPAFRKPAEFDRRETEIFRKRTYLRCGGVIVARQEHDSPPTVYCRVLREDRGGQMIEALDQPSASESLRDEPGRSLPSQFLGGHAVCIGHIDDGLPLPGGERLRDIRVRLEMDGQEDDFRLDASASVLGRTLGPIAAASAAKLAGSRVVATDTSMPLRANALARAWPILPKPIIA